MIRLSNSVSLRAVVLMPILILAACRPAYESPTGALPYYSEETFTPAWYQEDAVPSDLHSISAFELLDQNGAVVTEADLEGRITVANFFFTDCAGICPTTMASLTRLNALFADDPEMILLSHSAAPKADSVPKLRDFAVLIGAEAPKWRLLTGDPLEMYALARTAYFADEDLGEGRAADDPSFLHSEGFYLLDGSRRIRGIYNGMNVASVSQLVADARILQDEMAGDGRRP